MPPGLYHYESMPSRIYIVKQFLVLGHEASGEIIAVGFTIKNFRVGDRVVFELQ
jgi:threonine dehydrogenase-like Zn-dependent dehydrogenase